MLRLRIGAGQHKSDSGLIQKFDFELYGRGRRRMEPSESGQGGRRQIGARLGRLIDKDRDRFLAARRLNAVCRTLLSA